MSHLQGIASPLMNVIRRIGASGTGHRTPTPSASKAGAVAVIAGRRVGTARPVHGRTAILAVIRIRVVFVDSRRAVSAARTKHGAIAVTTLAHASLNDETCAAKHHAM